MLQHPFVDRQFPIITDGKLVKKEFGTGAVKVTPSHDPNDYECGQRNKLQFINILNEDGTLNDNAGEFKGMLRFEARVAVIKKLEEAGLYKGKEKNAMVLKVCSRSGDIIEPFMSPQWYVDLNDLAKKSVDAVANGDLVILPESKVSVWNEFLNNIRPWCISRQLWWGHRIPAYIAWKKGESKPDTSDTNNWFVAESDEEAREIAASRLGTSEFEIEQDPDVLDTWFSSGLFPFSVFGWPEKTLDLEKYYPTHMLETGHDILFFWVARMVMMGLQLTGKLPFNEVLLHSLVRDKNGKKMSKTSGNVIDPIDVIEGITLEELHETIRKGNLRKDKQEEAIKTQKKDFPKGISECGTDALRFALCAYTAQGKDINLDVARVEGYRAFCNKIWQATKLGFMFLGASFVPAVDNKTKPEGLYDQWILAKLAKTIKDVTESWTTYDFSSATSAIHSFFLYSFCDIYLEAVKATMFSPEGQNEEQKAMHRETVYTVLEESFRLLHPFMPYLSEELWQRLPRRPSSVPAQKTISYTNYPLPSTSEHWENASAVEDVEFLNSLNAKLRSACATYGIIKKKTATVTTVVTDQARHKLITSQLSTIVALSFLKELIVLETEVIPSEAATEIVDATCTLYIHLQGIDAKKELVKLDKSKANLTKQIEALTKKQQDERFIEKAPENVKIQIAENLAQFTLELAGVQRAIDTLSSMQ
eukprot:TRINITY_DN996_c0_g1_i2.p1 TRINITY_DN996_c0_g1~~TRINITY_DN996_c0_g1_i2.p1  ORF type:complete len:704 (-),score=234.47 TRINITY_DN996_c0_g1_i2:36-2147(-)